LNRTDSAEHLTEASNPPRKIQLLKQVIVWC